jgi:hypothetical protein
MPTASLSSGLRLNIADPQSPQNHFSQPSPGVHDRSRSSPATILNVPGSGRTFADAAAPLRRWQRLQWQ